jgi:class 3 adenylate cyclase
MARCPGCSADVRPGTRFCAECGQRLPPRCPHCGHANAATAKFCVNCGQAAAAPPPAPDAERRHLTVMFCDLADSTALSTRLDPEDHREVLRAYQAACARAVSRYEGHLAQFLGDGVMAYFGYPKAHEDDAERAALAGLEIVAAVAGLSPLGVAIRARVGIASGLAVVGDKIAKGSDWEVGVVGETPNLAARLQGLAKPGEVVIGPHTRRLLGGQFEYQDLGAHTFKGFAQPLEAFRVVSAVALDSRFKALRGFNVGLVDRREEQALLKALGARAARGGCQAVLIQGEAGIGKSRLAHALAEWMVESGGARLVEMQCSAHHTHSALFPAVNALRQLAFGGRRRQGGGTPWEALAQFLGETLGEEGGEALPLFASLLSIPAPEGYPVSQLPPERQALLRHLLELFAGCGGGGPVLLLMEDLHWADPSTLEFAGHLVAHGGDRRLLMLSTARPEFAPSWAAHPGATLLPLGRLPDEDAAELVRQAACGLEGEAVEAVVAKTDGVPLYLLEYAKAVAEAGGPGGGRVIPSSLHDLLLARLDRLGEAKAVAQAAALLGREFDGQLLEAVWEHGAPSLEAGLGRLLSEALVRPKGGPARRRYEFRHALIQDAAYESLLKSRRAAAHRRIAEVAERDFPETAEAEPEWLAQHFSLAGLPGRAAAHWERAGIKG